MFAPRIIGVLTLFATLTFAAPNPAPNPALSTTTKWGWLAGVHHLATNTATPSPSIILASRDEPKEVLMLKRSQPVPRELLVDTISTLDRRELGISWDNSCGSLTNWKCSTNTSGPCCSQHGWCGNDGYYCGGGCQWGYGKCVVPYLQLQFDADPGDTLWDPVSDNVFDAEPGDGMLYYGNAPIGYVTAISSTSSGWPIPVTTETITV